MTYEEKKQWLRLYRKAERWEQIKLDEVEQQRTAATRVTQVLSSMPGGTGDGQALARAVERIEAAQLEAAQAAEQCAAVMQSVKAVLDQIPDFTDYEILYRRYVRGEHWETIAYLLPMDLSRVYRRHKAAVMALKIPEEASKSTVLHCFALFRTDSAWYNVNCRKPQGDGPHIHHPAAFVLPGCDRGTHIYRPTA